MRHTEGEKRLTDKWTVLRCLVIMWDPMRQVQKLHVKHVELSWKDLLIFCKAETTDAIGRDSWTDLKLTLDHCRHSHDTVCMKGSSGSIIAHGCLDVGVFIFASNFVA